MEWPTLLTLDDIFVCDIFVCDIFDWNNLWLGLIVFTEKDTSKKFQFFWFILQTPKKANYFL